MDWAVTGHQGCGCRLGLSAVSHFATVLHGGGRQQYFWLCGVFIILFVRKPVGLWYTVGCLNAVVTLPPAT